MQYTPGAIPSDSWAAKPLVLVPEPTPPTPPTPDPAGWTDDPDVILWWDLRDSGPEVVSRITGGASLTDTGDIEVTTESYSPDGLNCRHIPDSSTTAQLVGENTPRAWTDQLTEYTIEWWMNWTGNSEGLNSLLPIFTIIDSELLNGLYLAIENKSGAVDNWKISVYGFVDGTPEGSAFDTYKTGYGNGWRYYAIKCTGVDGYYALYVNGELVDLSPGITFLPASPALGVPITYITYNLEGGGIYGDISALRMLKRALTDEEVMASYLQCTVSPT